LARGERGGKQRQVREIEIGGEAVSRPSAKEIRQKKKKKFYGVRRQSEDLFRSCSAGGVKKRKYPLP